MKTSLTVKQILDLGGKELLMKVLAFNNMNVAESDFSQLPETCTLIFDSEFKFPEVNYEKLKIYSFSVGRYEDTRYMLVFAYSAEEALKKAQYRAEEKITMNDLEEINIAKAFFDTDGVLQL